MVVSLSEKIASKSRAFSPLILAMKRPILLLALFSALDEIVTFSILSNGGVELNPRVVWLLSINPLLWPLCDVALLLIAWIVHEQGIKRKVDLWYIWIVAGLARLLAVALSLT
ncbi:hypothetical protein ES703_120898 [subsurface metagenome]